MFSDWLSLSSCRAGVSVVLAYHDKRFGQTVKAMALDIEVLLGNNNKNDSTLVFILSSYKITASSVDLLLAAFAYLSMYIPFKTLFVSSDALQCVLYTLCNN